MTGAQIIGVFCLAPCSETLASDWWQIWQNVPIRQYYIGRGTLLYNEIHYPIYWEVERVDCTPPAHTAPLPLRPSPTPPLSHPAPLPLYSWKGGLYAITTQHSSYIWFSLTFYVIILCCPYESSYTNQYSDIAWPYIQLLKSPRAMMAPKPIWDIIRRSTY